MAGKHYLLFNNYGPFSVPSGNRVIWCQAINIEFEPGNNLSSKPQFCGDMLLIPCSIYHIRLPFIYHMFSLLLLWDGCRVIWWQAIKEGSRTSEPDHSSKLIEVTHKGVHENPRDDHSSKLIEVTHLCNCIATIPFDWLPHTHSRVLLFF